MPPSATDRPSQTDPKAPKFKRWAPSLRRRQLIDAAIRCLGEGGISAFTIERICQEARVSRGLINHYFDSKDELLVHVYAAMTAYLPQTVAAGPDAGTISAEDQLKAIIELSFDAPSFDPSRLRAWLAVWGEVSVNERLRALHRERYSIYEQGVAGAISVIASERERAVDGCRFARSLIALIDGLWLRYCLDPAAITLDDAKADCYTFIGLHVGAIG